MTVSTRAFLNRASLPITAFVSTATAEDSRYRPFSVRFPATSTIVRVAFAPNQDIYLAELSSHSDDQRVLTWLIDKNPSYRTAVPPQTQTAASGAALTIRRDHTYDTSVEHMPTKIPVHSSANLSLRPGYVPKLPQAVTMNAILPSQRTEL